MTEYVKFTKMHGAGNDYIYVNVTEAPLHCPEELSILWSKYHTGIGSDGLVLIGKSDVADFSMRIFNADGSEALMCGNATRCIGKYVYDKGLTDKEIITLETLSGIKELKLTIQDKAVTEVTVNMGSPVIGDTEMILTAADQSFTGSVVSMGNPHFVIFIENIDTFELEKYGPLLENNPVFPDRTNVEFAQLIAPDVIRMRVWERGSGVTQACGTGACATAVAAIVHQKTGRKVQVVMDGGPLTIEWEEKENKIWMTGGATEVFEGSIRI